MHSQTQITRFGATKVVNHVCQIADHKADLSRACTSGDYVLLSPRVRRHGYGAP